MFFVSFCEKETPSLVSGRKRTYGQGYAGIVARCLMQVKKIGNAGESSGTEPCTAVQAAGEKVSVSGSLVGSARLGPGFAALADLKAHARGLDLDKPEPFVQ